jgi:hypothetical protein
MDRASRPPRLHLLIILGGEYKSRNSSLCSFLRPPITSFLLGPNILLRNLFSNTLSLCSSRNVRETTVDANVSVIALDVPLAVMGLYMHNFQINSNEMHFLIVTLKKFIQASNTMR